MAQPSISGSAKKRGSTGAWLLLGGIALLAVIALGSLLKARYDTGETYPIYSTKRSDPLGARAVYESLALLPDVKVEQNFMPIERLDGQQGTALVMLGLNPRSFNSSHNEDATDLGRFVASGGRLIIALNPEVGLGRMQRAWEDAKRESREEQKGDKKDKPKAKKKESSAKKSEKKSKPATKPSDDKKDVKPTSPIKQSERHTSLAELLKVSIKSREFIYTGDKSGSPITLTSDVPLVADESPLWMSNVFLDDTPTQDWSVEEDVLVGIKEKTAEAKTDKAKAEQGTPKPKKATEPSPWKILATKGERAMIAERKLGLGSVIVCTDRYFLSNEALWKDPKPAFIAWLFGSSRKIIFEETHLGPAMGDQEGIMTLARRYRMEGLFLGGILLFALYIWRNAFSLVPANADDDLGLWRGEAVAGRGAASGLEGLLRRGISAKALLKRCFETWCSTRSASLAVPADRLAKATALMATEEAQKHPAATYNALRETLHPPRH